MDLANIKPIEKRYNFRHPGTGEKTGLILVIACAHDERVVSAIRDVNDDILKAGTETTDEQNEVFHHRMSAAYIVGIEFEGDATWRGETPEFSAELAQDVCSNSAIREKVLIEARQISDFYQA